MDDYAAIADEIARAREDHLNSFGSSPVDVAKKRAALERVLREDVFAIIQALRIAAVHK